MSGRAYLASEGGLSSCKQTRAKFQMIAGDQILWFFEAILSFNRSSSSQLSSHFTSTSLLIPLPLPLPLPF
jgi:hypothetical protein